MKTSLKDNLKIEHFTDEKTGCEYIYTKIKRDVKGKGRINVNLRFTARPFKNATSLCDYAKKHNSLYLVNGGLFHTKTNIPECLLIKNGKIIYDRKEKYVHVNANDGEEKRDVLFNLGITYDGDLKVYDPKVKAKEMIEDGIKDAIMGFGPLMIDGKPNEELDETVPFGSYLKKQRQIIGQDEYKDYFVITVLEPGMTYADCRDLLQRLNIKNAYALDGGSSTQTASGKEMLTNIKRNGEFRKIPTILTFDIKK